MGGNIAISDIDMEEFNREEGGEQDVTLSAADADGSIRLLNLIIGKDHQLGKCSKAGNHKQPIKYKLIDILGEYNIKAEDARKMKWML